MIAPTRLRGFSDAYGSWKTICISRRSGRSSRARQPRDARPRSAIVARRSARAAARSCAPSVDLPQPDSPTRPSVSPSRTENDTPSTAWTRADLAPRAAPCADREVLHEVARPRASGVADARVTPAAGSPADRRARAARACSRRSSQQRSRWAGPRRAPRAPGSSSHCVERVRAARRGSGIRRAGRSATAACPRSSAAAPAWAGRGAGSTRAGPTCTGAAGRRRSRRASPCSTIRPAYMTDDPSAMSATTPRSWVIRITAESNSSLQPLDQLEDLRLDRHVERGRRLVGDQDARGCRRAPWRSSRAGASRRRTGAGSRRRAVGLGIPTCASRSTARAARRPCGCRWCARIASTIWSPTV